jgi:hypothetical protein
VAHNAEHQIEDFPSIVEKMGLHKVTYNVGWTAWLDIARMVSTKRPHSPSSGCAREWLARTSLARE